MSLDTIIDATTSIQKDAHRLSTFFLSVQSMGTSVVYIEYV